MDEETYYLVNSKDDFILIEKLDSYQGRIKSAKKGGDQFL